MRSRWFSRMAAPRALTIAAVVALTAAGCKPSFNSPTTSASTTPDSGTGTSGSGSGSGTTAAGTGSGAGSGSGSGSGGGGGGASDPSAKVVFTTQASTTVQAGVALGTTPVVQVQDASGALVAASSAGVSLAAFANAGCSAPAGGSLRLGAVVGASATASGGTATFANLNYTSVGVIRLKAMSGTLTSDCSNAITVSAGTAAALSFSQQPSSTGTANTNFAQQPIVRVDDAVGNHVTTATNAVSLAAYVDSGCVTGAPGFSATGLPVSASAGLATHSGVKTTRAGATYLLATASGLTPACSNLVSVVAASASAATSSIVGTTPVGADGIEASTVTIYLRDTYGNFVDGVTPTFSATGSSNSYGACSVSNSSGVSTCTLTSTFAESKQLSITAPVSQTGSIVAFVNGVWTTAHAPLSTMPAPKQKHTAVWTGTQVIYFGGERSNTGAIYDPATNAWVTTTTTVGAPVPTYDHVATWTGSRMLVWGGQTGSNAVGIFDPVTNTWTTATTANAPSAAWNGASVWTGSKWFVWGGGCCSNAGGLYDPVANTWTQTPTANAPTWRQWPAAVLAGSKIVVWGGSAAAESNSGGIYDISGGTWLGPTQLTGVPAGRYAFAYAWTGNRLVVWGGYDPVGGTPINTGGYYDPNSGGAGSWTAATPTGAGSLTTRYGPAFAWDATTSNLFIWGGSGGGNGARLNVASNAWTLAMTTAGAPPSTTTGPPTVWTGTQMVLWGGSIGSSPTNEGGRYDSATNTWLAPHPSGQRGTMPRAYHASVFTGSKIIIWGGILSNLMNTGAIYDVPSDSWQEINTVGAPSARSMTHAAWTGRTFVVLTGDGNINTGGMYDPESQVWTATNTTSTNAPPTPLGYYGASVWTGSRVVIWGGNASGTYKNTGYIFDPNFNTWTTPISNALANTPSRRYGHTAIWTGSRLIIWGGYTDTPSSAQLNDGASYDMRAGTWSAISGSGANVPSPRVDHGAVWTGSRMIVWGNYNGDNTGGIYNPSTNSWSATSTGTGVAIPRSVPNIVWDGEKMIVFGGANQTTGASYNPTTNSWGDIPNYGQSYNRYQTTPHWTGKYMAMMMGKMDSSFGFESGAKFRPLRSASWGTATPLIGSNPSGRTGATGRWDGGQLAIWGGYDGAAAVNTGVLLDPVTNIWVGVTVGNNTPSPRYGHSMVWSGIPVPAASPQRFVVWGGTDGTTYFNTGGLLDPYTGTWGAMASAFGPSPRAGHVAVNSGTMMIVWGGTTTTGTGGRLNTGTNYSYNTAAWAATITTVGAPLGRSNLPGIWTGRRMFIWGGTNDGTNGLNDGALYNWVSNTWTPISSTGAPAARMDHYAVWTGKYVLVFGGSATAGSGYYNDGAKYDPINDVWSPMAPYAIGSRASASIIWTGSKMVIWGGNVGATYLNTGAAYDVEDDTWTAISSVGAPSVRAAQTAIWTGAVGDGLGSATSYLSNSSGDHGRIYIWGGHNGGAYLNTGGSLLPP